MAGNTLFGFESELAKNVAVTSNISGQNEFRFGEFDSQGNVILNSLIRSSGLRSGDIGPTPEPTTEDRQYDDGTTRTFETGENLGSKTVEIEGASDEPVIALLLKYSRFGASRGRLFAYEAFNDDRTCFYGSAKINSAIKPRDVKGIWRFVLAFQEVQFRPASQNPVPDDANAPAGTMDPTTGPVGTEVTVTGTKLDTVTAVTFGSETIPAASFTSQTAEAFVYVVPAGQTAGAKAVAMTHPSGTVSLGDFTVS